MSNRRQKNLMREFWHPTNKDLMVYLNGGLLDRKAARVKSHLENCWSCKATQKKIEDSFLTYVERRSTAFGDIPLFSSGDQQQFEAKLRRLALASRERPLFSLLLDSLTGRRFPLQRASLSFALCALVFWLGIFLYFRLSSVPTVSAKEILQRAENAETERILQVPDAVIYQKLQVRRNSLSSSKKEERVLCEIWRDTNTRRFRTRVADGNGQRFIEAKEEDDPKKSLVWEPSAAPAILANLQEVFRHNRMDLRRPLTSASLQAWRNSLPRKSEQVSQTEWKDGYRAFKLTTTPPGPFSVNSIVKVDWVVRAEDWHPVEQSLLVQGKEGVESYELTETAYELVALNALPFPLFADANPAPPQLVLSPTPIPKLPGPSTAESIAAEIEVLYGLHHTKACLGEQIEIGRDALGQIEVRGLIDSNQRKEELTAALQGIPFVKLQIQTVEEVVASGNHLAQFQPNPNLSESTASAPPQDFTSTAVAAQIPIHDFLKHYLREQRALTFPELKEINNVSAIIQEEMTNFTNQVISSSQVLMSEVWALRRLAERYEQRSELDLSLASQRLLAEVLGDHLKEVRVEIQSLRQLLGPFLSTIVNSNVSSDALAPLEEEIPLVPMDSHWQERVLGIFSNARKTEGFILDLFGLPGPNRVSVENSAQSLLSSLPKMAEEFQACEEQVAREFSNHPEQLSLKSQTQ